MSKKVAIGIDLGTTHSCVAIFIEGKVEIIADEMGRRITPSCVGFTDVERLIGAAALSQANVNPRNTIFEAKRLIGRRFTDPIVQTDIEQWPFEVVNSNGVPKFKVQYKSEDKIFTPELISSMVLSKMKAIAEKFVHGEVSDAVIAVPAYFTDSQRQATKDAGEIAGLNVLNLIHEPTAAAIAYGVEKKVTDKLNIMIYDLGGGTFDVTILSIADGVFVVKAVGGDTHLGGGDFDNRLVKHFLQTISPKPNTNLLTNQKAMGRLRRACKFAKQSLSSALKANIDIPHLFDGNDFSSTISRAQFEDLCSDLFQQTMEHVTTTLNDSGLREEDIQEVVLVGGSTRIPKIQQLLQELFHGKRLNKTIQPDDAVAYGAAIKAAILSGDNTIDEIKLFDVTPLTLSIENPDQTVTALIKRNTKIPIKKTMRRTTVSDYQSCVRFNIYEGENTLSKSNNLLGSFRLDNIENALKCVPIFSLTYLVDENGILHATAIDRKTSCANGITISKGRLERKEIEQMIVEAAKFNLDDLQLARRDHDRQTLEKYCLDAIIVANEAVGGGSDELREALRSKCTQVLEWIDDNCDADEQEHIQKLEHIKSFCDSKLVSVQLSALGHTLNFLKNIVLDPVQVSAELSYAIPSYFL